MMALLAAAVLPGPGMTEEASSGAAGVGEWVAGYNGRARLVAGPLLGSGERIVGVHIETEIGWHTYWRNPGDSGVPPTFDWTGSQNLDAAKVKWPAPQSLPLEYATSIGYEDEVVFPVVISPQNATLPLELSLRLDYAVCLDICIPLSAELSASIEPHDLPDPVMIGLVNSYNATVPRVQDGISGPAPRIVKSWVEEREGVVVLHVEAMADPSAELFVEGPSKFYFAVPGAPASSGADSVVFTVEVDGATAPSALDGAQLTATLVSVKGAVEHSWTVE